jgi:hypothetical protein
MASSPSSNNICHTNRHDCLLDPGTSTENWIGNM